MWADAEAKIIINMAAWASKNTTGVKTLDSDGYIECYSAAVCTISGGPSGYDVAKVLDSAGVEVYLTPIGQAAPSSQGTTSPSFNIIGTVVDQPNIPDTNKAAVVYGAVANLGFNGSAFHVFAKTANNKLAGTLVTLNAKISGFVGNYVVADNYGSPQYVPVVFTKTIAPADDLSKLESYVISGKSGS
ncbi:hypothetical protein MHBO_004902, partial [Bonamia ostreae]